MGVSSFKRIVLPNVLEIDRGGTGSTNGSISGSGTLSFTAGGSNNDINLDVGNGTGSVNAIVSSTTGNTVEYPLTVKHLDADGAASSNIGVGIRFNVETTTNNLLVDIGSIYSQAITNSTTPSSKMVFSVNNVSASPNVFFTFDSSGLITAPSITANSLTTVTATADTNTTQVATTAFVLGQASSVAGSNISGSAGIVGTSYKYARADHTHQGVYSITGTTNQVSATAAYGAITLSLPQNIHTGASPTFSGLNTGSGTITSGSLLPSATDTYDIGSPTAIYKSQYVSTINATIFAENQQTLMGGWFTVGKGQGTLPAVSSAQTSIDFGQTMTPGHFVVIKAKDAFGTPKVEYLTVGTLVSGTTYNVSRDIAASHGTDPVWPDGTAYLVLGNDTGSGSGRIELNAYDTPRLSIIKQGATYNAQSEIARFGDVNGLGGVSGETYGLFIGSVNKYLLYNSSTDVLTVTGTLNASSGLIGSSATNKWTIGSDATNASIYSGTKSSISSTAVGIYIGTDGISMSATAVAPTMFLDTTKLALGSAASGLTVAGTSAGTVIDNAGGFLSYLDANNYIRRDGTKLDIKSSTFTLQTSSTGSIGLTATSYSAGNGVWISSTAGSRFRVGNASASRIQWDDTDLQIYNSSNALVASFGGTNSIAGWGITTTAISKDKIKLNAATNTSNIIIGDATAYDTGNGFWLGQTDATTYKMSIRQGDARVLWTSTALQMYYGSTPKKVFEVNATGATIASWNIDDTAIYTGAKGSDGVATSTGITLGSTGFLSGPKFFLKSDGSGAIGGWALGTSSLTSGSGSNTVGLDSGGINPAIYAGSATPSSAPFQVSQTGAITSTSGTIAGWTIDANKIQKISTGEWQTGNVGFIRASNISIPGNFYSGTGVLKGFSVGSNQSGNAHTIVLGQMMATGSTLKDGYIGIQMMDNNGTEYFALGANTNSTSAVYNKIAGWNFDSTAIYSGTKGSNATFTSGSSITIGSAGFISAPQFYLDSSGNARFKGTIGVGATALLVGDGVWIDPSGYFRAGTVAASALTEGILWNGTDFLVKSSYFNINADSSGTLGNSALAWTTSGTVTIGTGWTVGSNSIYSGTKSSISSTAVGIYIGTDGISMSATAVAPTIFLDTTKLALGSAASGLTVAGTSSGTVIDNAGGFLSYGDANNYIRRSGTSLDIKSATFALATSNITVSSGTVAATSGDIILSGGDTKLYIGSGVTLDGATSGSIKVSSTVLLDGASTGKFALGTAASLITAAANTGIYMDGSGSFRVGTATTGTNYLYFNGTSLDIKSDTFALQTTSNSSIGLNATSYSAGDGVWLSTTAGNRFRVGNASGARLQWNDTDLQIYNSTPALIASFGGTNSIAGWTLTEQAIKKEIVSDKRWIIAAATAPSDQPYINEGFTLFRADSDMVAGDVKVVSLGKLRTLNTSGTFTTSPVEYGFEILKGLSASTKHIMRVGGQTAMIAGWNFDENKFSGGNTSLKATGILSMGTGTDAFGSANRVYIDGSGAGAFSVGANLKYSSDVLTVSGWTINSSTITSTGITLENSATAASANIRLGAASAYNVGTGFWADGSGRIRIGTIDSGAAYLLWDGTNLSWKGANTSLTTAGAFSATSATITGVITANTGYIGGATGWTIASNKLTTTSSSNYIAGGSTTPTGINTNDTGFYIGGTGLFRVGTADGTILTNGIQWTGTKVLIKATNISVNSDDSVSVTGAISATSGTIGSFTIGTHLNTGSKSTYNDDIAGVHVGSDGIGLGSTFKVSAAGALTATSGTIANWTINTDNLSTGAFDTSGKMYFGTTGLSLSNTFKVTAAGALTATSGTFGGMNLNATSLWLGGTGVYQAAATTLYVGTSGISLTDKFSVTTAGALTATSGTIAGWTMASTKLYNGSGAGTFSGLIVATGANKTFFTGADDNAGANAKAYINADGSGSLASGNFSWTAAGVVTIGTGVSVEQKNIKSKKHMIY